MPVCSIAVLALPVASGAELLLLPAGAFSAPDGALEGEGPWHLPEEAGAALAERLRAGGRDLVIDFEHQTLLAAKNGQPAPAAGWVIARAIQWHPGRGLVAEEVRWSARAAAMIEAGEYRFLSPVFRYDRKGVPTALLHVALTNTPALPSLPEVRLAAASLSNPNEEDPMDLAALRSLLGLGDAADEAAVTQAIADLKSQAGQVAGLTEQVAALKAASPAPDLTQWVPMAVHREAMAALRGLQSQGAESELAALIEQGLAKGQIPGAATAEWLRGQGIAATRAYLEDAPAIAALGATQSGARKGPASSHQPRLASEELAVLAQMGIDETAYLKTRATLFPDMETAR